MSEGPQTKDRIAILVVDDEPFVRMDVAEILRQAGFMWRKPAIRTKLSIRTKL